MIVIQNISSGCTQDIITRSQAVWYCCSFSLFPQVTSNDKTPTVISSALEKHSQDPKQASRYELIQLLPEGKELVIPATGNVFYAMTSSSVDFLLRRQGGNTPFRSQPISTETSATFPRIKAKGRRQLFPK